jgi:TRAP-type C4-dicarboxylate transport system substrate-binding protein
MSSKQSRWFKGLGSWVVAAAAAATLGWLPAGAAAQAVVLKIGTVDAPTSHSGAGAEAFAAEVARLSNGQMKVEVFHAGKLGSIPEQVKNVLQGAQDLHLLYPEFLTNLIDESKVISVPYLFRDMEHAQAYLKGDLFKPGLDKLRGMGGVILDPDWNWKINDPRGVIAVRPIRTPADLKGLKLRLWESKVAIETWRGLGANTIVVARPEMYLAFKQGIIEGGPETIGIAYDQKNAELAKYWTRTEEYYQIINVMMNARKYNSLTPQQREILHTAARNASRVFQEASGKGFTEKRQKAEKDFGVTVLQPDLGPWREQARAISAALEKEGVIPAGLADKVRAMK